MHRPGGQADALDQVASRIINKFTFFKGSPLTLLFSF